MLTLALTVFLSLPHPQIAKPVHHCRIVKTLKIAGRYTAGAALRLVLDNKGEPYQ